MNERSLNISDYIATGILESYVLGLLNPVEVQEVEQYAALYPEIRAEIEQIEQTLFQYAQGFELTPPPALKHQIWETLNALPAASTNDEKKLTAEIPQPIPTPIVVVRRITPVRYWAMVAVILCLIISIFFNVVLYQLWVKAVDKYLAVSKVEIVLNKALVKTQNQTDRLTQELQLSKNETFKRVGLYGQGLHLASKVTLYWNEQTQEVLLATASLQLPDAPRSKQYQLWAIVDNVPQDMGVLPNDTLLPALITMKRTATAQAFAITLEKEGGNSTPDLNSLFVMGAVK